MIPLRSRHSCCLSSTARSSRASFRWVDENLRPEMGNGPLRLRTVSLPLIPSRTMRQVDSPCSYRADGSSPGIGDSEITPLG